MCLLIAIVLSQALGPKPIPPDLKAPEYGRDDQCERLRTGSSVMEPENTWSNLGYLYAGFLILFRNLSPKRLFQALFGGSMVFLAWLSGLYHAQPVSALYRHLDVATIYWVLPLLIAYAAHGIFVYRFPDIGWGKTHIIGVGIIVVCLGTVLPFIGTDSTMITLILISVLMILSVWTLAFKKLFYPLSDVERAFYGTGMLVLLLASGLFRFFDGRGEFLGLPKFFCSEGSPVQAHALWHICGALTLFLGFEFFSRAFSDEGNLLPFLSGGRRTYD